MLKNVVFFSTVIVILLCLSWTAISSLTFFSSDVGLRFLQIQELVDHRWRTFAIDYPARTVDPELAHVPYYYAYSVIDDELYLNVSPFFPLLVSLLYASLGAAGLPIVPALGSALAAWATYRLVRLSELPYARLAFVAALFTTPLLFYGMVLWDHSFGAALGLWAVYGVARGIEQSEQRSIFFGGVAAGLALGQRPEMYLFAGALGSSLLLLTWPRWRPVLSFAVGGIAASGAIWWLQYLWVGHPLGMALAPHVLGYGAPATAPVASANIPLFTKLARFWVHTEPGSAWQTWATVLVMVGGGVFVSLVLLGRPRSRWGLAAGFLLMLAGYLLFAWVAVKSALIGVAATFPLLPFALLSMTAKRDRHAQHRTVYLLVLFTALIFLGLICLLWPGYGGLQWGSRYLLPLYPLLLVLAWVGYAAYAERFSFSWTVILRGGALALLAAALLLSGMGAYRIYVDHPKHSAIREDLLAVPAAWILTDHVFMPSFMTSVSNAKTFLYVRNQEQLDTLLARLREHGIEQVGVTPRTRSSLVGDEVIGEFMVEKRELPAAYLIQYVYEFRPKASTVRAQE